MSVDKALGHIYVLSWGTNVVTFVGQISIRALFL